MTKFGALAGFPYACERVNDVTRLILEKSEVVEYPEVSVYEDAKVFVTPNKWESDALLRQVQFKGSIPIFLVVDREVVAEGSVGGHVGEEMHDCTLLKVYSETPRVSCSH